MVGALALRKAMLGSLRDLMPIVLVIAFFQLFVLQEPLPHLLSVLSGLVLVVLGLTFFHLWPGNGAVSDRRVHGSGFCPQR